MKQETYIRRALFAPILIPILANVYLLNGNKPDGFTSDPVANNIMVAASILLISLCMEGIPYLWMLYAKRDLLFSTDSKALPQACIRLPITMLKYYWMFWAGATILLSPMSWGWETGLCSLIYGTVAVPIFGYAYCALTFLFLRLFQAVGLIEREPGLIVADVKPFSTSVMPVEGR